MAERAYIVTKGVVLRETETKEADKILTLLTADGGKISVIARGVRRKSCKYAACAQQLALLRVDPVPERRLVLCQ